MLGGARETGPSPSGSSGALNNSNDVPQINKRKIKCVLRADGDSRTHDNSKNSKATLGACGFGTKEKSGKGGLRFQK